MTPLQIPSATLSNGVTMPRLVFGTYQIKDPKICQKAVEDALEAGYRAIDTAQSYGNEAAVGRRSEGLRTSSERTLYYHETLGGRCV